ncbi:penicillin-binding protein activator [Idiomarina xiamenensis]|uniref:Lipoprotein n=1 Tax=Idiomarina xiamenensis 10-D-4 TaxID=740709 RepID=K2L6D1_9GAMM|nr:penicillin-binding protein activator [Idiomarina xiamenensis]EKE85350.1 lipoprotein [Idiomarina xiamenensis 10-D-4]
MLKTLILLTMAGLLTACASSVPSPRQQHDASSDLPVLPEARRNSAADWLAEARQASDAKQQQHALLLAASRWQSEQQWQRAAAIISQLNSADLAAEDWRQYRLLQAQFALQQQQWAQVIERLQGITGQFTDRAERAHVLGLLALAHQQQGDYVEAAKFRIEQQRYVSDEQQAQQTEWVWQALSEIPSSQLGQLKLPSDQYSAGWLRLIERLHQALDKGEDIDAAINEWQKSYPRHPANEVLKAQFGDWLTAPLQQRLVAVVLPLSGRFEQQGLAIRDGILAALTKQPDIEARFFDSNQLAPTVVIEKLQGLAPDYVIGPLLKDQVEQYRPLSRWPQLYLNEKSSLTSAEANPDVPQQYQHFFALDPESEVRQAAELIYQRGQRAPLVFAADNARGQRLAEQFSQHWALVSAQQQALDVGFYRSTDDMKNVVQEQLGVNASNERIRYVKIAAGKVIVDDVPRSRQDIDAIYLTGSVEQTRLLKPFIDVTVSPFAERIPVYANSASHMQNSSISENDLDQVMFSDAPWLMPDNKQQALLTELLQLRNGWGFNNARFAAMGYDAAQLIDRLAVMDALPGYQYQGLSGALSVRLGQVQRQLQWAKFEQHSIKPLVVQSAQTRSR